MLDDTVFSFKYRVAVFVIVPQESNLFEKNLWNGEGKTPTMLVKGIAEFVQLQGRFAASPWSESGGRNKWDGGYQLTVRFLEYCERMRRGFAAERAVGKVSCLVKVKKYIFFFT
ncbi:Uncharacterized protein Fot_27418 [Forsythia ovata]|uniref:Uncharacterized protein n=1 Tax=Forsythia ovata TaxID=205694 RepID=A0ABD1TL41_9LAMI